MKRGALGGPYEASQTQRKVGIGPRRGTLTRTHLERTQSEEGRLPRRAFNAEHGEGTVEGAGGTTVPPAGPSGVCAAPAARPGTSRDSVQAVVLPGRHRRPVTSPMTQLGGPVECPSLPPWCTYNHEPSCLIAAPSRNPSLLPVKAPAGLLAGRAALIAGESNQIMGRVAGQGDQEYSRHRVRPRPAQDAGRALYSAPCAAGESGLQSRRSSVSCPSASQKPP